MITLNKSREDYPLTLEQPDVQEILRIGRRASYELLNDPPFHVIRMGKSRTIKVSRDALFDWLEGKQS
ncbi:DNA-binding protein [Paenibacillus sp. BIHB 4019]|uniref:DNA-binding protein n=1 Tax=Paenibacillus sp. BIHB 4019 TaxID=1870819 RepID=A0A1B2DTJ3_9BACL|nr:DNA-binding protein [Paenibacillus sp. BIHB 4019]